MLFTESVHNAGGRILSQLWRVGRISDPIYLDGAQPVVASAIRPAATFGYVTHEAGRRNIAFIFALEGMTEPRLGTVMKEAFGGPFSANQQLSFNEASTLVQSGEAHAVSWGQFYIANPDLLERYARGAEPNQPMQETFYGGGLKGYIEYPVGNP